MNAAPLLAQEVIKKDVCPPNSAVCNDLAPGDDNSELFGKDGPVTKIVRFIIIIAGIVSVFMMVYAGFVYITSGGDPKRTATAKNTIIYAAIGIVIALISQSIVSFILVNIK